MCKFICIKKVYAFQVGKKYNIINGEQKKDIYLIQSSENYWWWYNYDFVQEYFIIDKQSQRELIINNLLNE